MQQTHRARNSLYSLVRSVMIRRSFTTAATRSATSPRFQARFSHMAPHSSYPHQSERHRRYDRVQQHVWNPGVAAWNEQLMEFVHYRIEGCNEQRNHKPTPADSSRKSEKQSQHGELSQVDHTVAQATDGQRVDRKLGLVGGVEDQPHP